MIMAEDIITTDAVPRVHTDGVLEGTVTQIRSDAEIQKVANVVSNWLPNPTYETGHCPENDANSSPPVQDNTTNPELYYIHNKEERLTNPGSLDNDVSNGYKENDYKNHMLYTTDAKVCAAEAIKISSADANIHPSSDENTCQNDIVASKAYINSPSRQNSGYTTDRSYSRNSLYEKATSTTTTNGDGNDKDVIPKDDAYSEIPEQVDVTDDDANLDHSLPYAVECEFTNPSYISDCNLTKHNSEKMVPGNNNNDKPPKRHVPTMEPADALNRNPMYVQNAPQQGRCQCTYGWVCIVVTIAALSFASGFFGIWLHYNNNGWKAQENADATTTSVQPAWDATYTYGHLAVDTNFTNGQSAADTTNTHGQTSSDTISHLAADTTENPVCPIAGYVSFNGVCYKDFAERKTYCDARQTCAADGGLLAMPKDKATNAFIHDLGGATDQRWIGLTDADSDGKWAFADGQTLEASGYNNWEPGEPNNLSGGEDCAEVGTKVHFWNDERCSRTKGFICQLVDTARTATVV
uniref:C-type lectin domain-containing protein n=1 Tax=Branchiostoma floridae TaxID=7739 RepID=C3XZP4_BRAFL|eukprot:XP_002610432.1 hypothetical protein BRAFLDRAFT_85571 [Branchiostoma floridae]